MNEFTTRRTKSEQKLLLAYILHVVNEMHPTTSVRKVFSITKCQELLRIYPQKDTIKCSYFSYILLMLIFHIYLLLLSTELRLYSRYAQYESAKDTAPSIKEKKINFSFLIFTVFLARGILCSLMLLYPVSVYDFPYFEFRLVGHDFKLMSLFDQLYLIRF